MVYGSGNTVSRGKLDYLEEFMDERIALDEGTGLMTKTSSDTLTHPKRCTVKGRTIVIRLTL